MNVSHHTTGRAGSFAGSVKYVSDKDKLDAMLVLNLTGANPAREMQDTADAARAVQKRERAQSGKKGEHAGPVAKNPVYHLAIAWHPDDKPDREHMFDQVKDALKRLHLQDHQTVIAIHNNTAHRHAHVIVNLVHPDTGKVATIVGNDRRLSEWAHEYESQRQIRSPKRAQKMATDHDTKDLQAEAIKSDFQRRKDDLRTRHDQAALDRRSERDALWDGYRAQKKDISDATQKAIDDILLKKPQPAPRPKHGFAAPHQSEGMQLLNALKKTGMKLTGVFDSKRKQPVEPPRDHKFVPPRNGHLTPNMQIAELRKAEYAAQSKAIKTFDAAREKMADRHDLAVAVEKKESADLKKDSSKAWAAWRESHKVPKKPTPQDVTLTVEEMKAEQRKNQGRLAFFVFKTGNQTRRAEGVAREAFNLNSPMQQARTAPEQQQAPEQKQATEKAAQKQAPKQTEYKYRVQVSHAEAQRQLWDALRENGFDQKTPPVLDGKWHPVALDGQRGKKSGTYRVYPDHPINGHMRDHRADKTTRWSAHGPLVELTPQESEKMRKTVEERQRREAEQTKRRHDRAAERAKKIVSNAKDADPDHPYLRAKGIEPHGILQSGANLVIPKRNAQGEIRSVETIAPDGFKKSMAGAETKGLFHYLGQKNDGPVRVVESFSTGASIREATGDQVVISFGKNNLPHAAEAVRSLTDREIIINGDNDVHHEQAGKPNGGRVAAEEAARAVDGHVQLPPEGGDWNDYHARHGIEATKSELSMARTYTADRSHFGDDTPIRHELPEAPSQGIGHG